MQVVAIVAVEVLLEHQLAVANQDRGVDQSGFTPGQRSHEFFQPFRIEADIGGCRHLPSTVGGRSAEPIGLDQSVESGNGPGLLSDEGGRPGGPVGESHPALDRAPAQVRRGPQHDRVAAPLELEQVGPVPTPRESPLQDLPAVADLAGLAGDQARGAPELESDLLGLPFRDPDSGAQTGRAAREEQRQADQDGRDASPSGAR